MDYWVLLMLFLVAIYSILIGAFMNGFWLFAMYSGMVPEEEKPWGITFHLFSEFTTATMLMLSGLAALLNVEWAKSVSLLALGMLMYIVIYSPGYYLQKKNRGMAVMFIALILLTTLAIIVTVGIT